MPAPGFFALAALAAPAAPQPAPPPRAAANEICPVMGRTVGEKSPVATARGRAYRICCAPCGAKLEKDPDRYLEPDGTPKNAPKNAVAQKQRGGPDPGGPRR